MLVILNLIKRVYVLEYYLPLHIKDRNMSILVQTEPFHIIVVLLNALDLVFTHTYVDVLDDVMM